MEARQLEVQRKIFETLLTSIKIRSDVKTSVAHECRCLYYYRSFKPTSVNSKKDALKGRLSCRERVAAKILPGFLYIVRNTKLHVTKLSAATRVSLFMHGIDDNQRFFAYVTSLPHVIELQNTDDALNLHPQLAAQVYGKFKEVVSDVVWRNKDSCRNIWFSPDSGSSGMPEGEALDEFRVLPNPYTLDDTYQFRFGADVYHTKLDGSALIHSKQEREYMAHPCKSFACLGVALTMCGPEAVVESYCSVMKTQQFCSCQGTETLALYAYTDGLLPMPAQCPHTIEKIAESIFTEARHTMSPFIAHLCRVWTKWRKIFVGQ